MFNFTFTATQVQKILPTNKQANQWYDVFNSVLPTFRIDSINRVASFLSQCAHESKEFTVMNENLNYSAAALVSVWPSHFDSTVADTYARHPTMIANRAYANRMGNGPEESGDGWKYHGRGPIQITGKANYTVCSQAVFADDRLVITPELLATDMDSAIRSACWYWVSRNLNVASDAGDVVTVTRKINGGEVGLTDRIQRFNAAVKILRGA